MARLIGIANGQVTSPIVRLSPGTYKHLFIHVTFTNGSSAVTPAHIGQITLTKNGFPMIASVDTINLMHIANMFGGQVRWNVTANNPADFVVPILCYDIASPNNGLFVGDNDLVNLQINWNATFLATNYATSTTVAIYGEDTDSVQNYMPVYTQFSYSSINSVRERLVVENVTRLFYNGLSDTHLAKFQVIVDGQLIHDVSRLALLSMSNWECQLEDATQIATSYITNASVGHLPIAVNGAISENLNDSIELAITSDGTAISPNIVTVGLDFTPDAQAITQAQVLNKAQTVLNRKQASGKSRAVNVYKAVNEHNSQVMSKLIGG